MVFLICFGVGSISDSVNQKFWGSFLSVKPNLGDHLIFDWNAAITQGETSQILAASNIQR